MTTELENYKKNRIVEVQNTYKDNISRLYSALLIRVRNILQSRQNNNIKNILINNLINKYKNDVNTIHKILNATILSIQQFIPKKITTNKNKNALLIGINYTGTQNELYGCINDVNSIKERIQQIGFTNINIMTDLTIEKATKTNILLKFKQLLINSVSGDLLFFVFSGHGSNTLDRNGDEDDGRDELIVSCDFKGILDDELKSLIQAHLKEGVTLVAVMDCCFSGSILDLKYQYVNSLDYDKYSENTKQLDTKGNVIMISGCNDNQTSADAVFNNKPNGAMTWALLEAIKQNKSLTWRQLMQNMRDLLKTSNFEQIPQFSSGTFTDIDAQVFI